VDVRSSGRPLEELVERFFALSGRRNGLCRDGRVGSGRECGERSVQRQQGYENAAPTGIDARWAWTQAGGEGQGVGVVDPRTGVGAWDTRIWPERRQR